MRNAKKMLALVLALVMCLALAVPAMAAEEPLDFAAITKLNAKFQEMNPDERSYITAAAVCIDKERSEIRYSFAGHNAPILLKKEEGIFEIEGSTPPISTWIPGFVYEDRAVPYKRGRSS